MRYRLRTLMILTALGPLLLAWVVPPMIHRYRQWQFDRLIDEIVTTITPQCH